MERTGMEGGSSTLDEDEVRTVALTGAAGKTGRAVTAQLLQRGVRVVALARDTAQAAGLRSVWAAAEVDIVVGDLNDENALATLTAGAQVVYHICPNMHPGEAEIGHKLVAAAQAASVAQGDAVHIVYHSVLHPQTPEMPHHWHKNLVEGQLWRSGLPVTLLQPAAYMQNVLAGRRRIVEEGLHVAPYATATRISMVDLNEVAEVAARVICEPGHRNATYELANGEALSQDEVADCLSLAVGRPVRAVALARDRWSAQAEAGGMAAMTINSLVRMFEYYESYGFRGSAVMLRNLLGRAPISFLDWARGIDWL